MKILAVVANTFREAIRDKILYNLVFFALLIMGISVVLGKLTLGEREKIIQDVSLAAMSVFGLLIAIFVGIGLVHKEIQRRTIYTLLAKPIARWQFVLGKYLGLLLTILINVVVMSAALSVLMIFFSEGGPNWGIGKAIILIMMELMVVTAVAVLFSTFTTPTLAAMYTLGVWVIGRFSSDLMTFAGKIKVPGLKGAITVAHYILPNLEKFDIKDPVVYRMPIPTEYILASLGYGMIYIVLVILLAIAIFERRDFK